MFLVGFVCLYIRLRDKQIFCDKFREGSKNFCKLIFTLSRYNISRAGVYLRYKEHYCLLTFERKADKVNPE